MDILKKLANSGPRDLIISLPKDKSWLEYLAYFTELKHKIVNLDIILPGIPKTDVGNKCYLVFDGYLRGWMEISKLKETPENEICMELMPYLNYSKGKVPMSEIEGFKYYFDNSDLQ